MQNSIITSFRRKVYCIRGREFILSDFDNQRSLMLSLSVFLPQSLSFSLSDCASVLRPFSSSPPLSVPLLLLPAREEETEEAILISLFLIPLLLLPGEPVGSLSLKRSVFPQALSFLSQVVSWQPSHSPTFLSPSCGRRKREKGKEGLSIKSIAMIFSIIKPKYKGTTLNFTEGWPFHC